MYRKNATRLLEWGFALLAIVVAWQLELPRGLSRLAVAVGATPGSWLYRVVVDGGVPLALVLIVAAAMKFYDSLIWPWFPGSDCKKGWWVYALVAMTEEATNDVVGYFRVLHDSSAIEIPEGHAYRRESGSLAYRGDWSSSAVFANRGDIRAVFNMRAVNPGRESMPSTYDGYLQIQWQEGEALIGTSCWWGFFQDLGDRRTIIGPVYAEHIRRFRRPKAAAIQRRMSESAAELVSRARMKITTTGAHDAQR